jgi:hypothetical protein
MGRGAPLRGAPGAMHDDRRAPQAGRARRPTLKASRLPRLRTPHRWEGRTHPTGYSAAFASKSSSSQIVPWSPSSALNPPSPRRPRSSPVPDPVSKAVDASAHEARTREGTGRDSNRVRCHGSSSGRAEAFHADGVRLHAGPRGRLVCRDAMPVAEASAVDAGRAQPVARGRPRAGPLPDHSRRSGVQLAGGPSSMARAAVRRDGPRLRTRSREEHSKVLALVGPPHAALAALVVSSRAPSGLQLRRRVYDVAVQ